MTTSAKIPRGWRVELLGLINAVKFDNGTRSLLWCDGRWTLTQNSVTMECRAIPYAADVKKARQVGAAFIAMIEGGE